MSYVSCARPACPGKPVAWLTYDYQARCVWLDDQPAPPGARCHCWALCDRHAGTLRAPRGWFCVDRRTSRAQAQADGHADGHAVEPLSAIL